MAVAKSWLLGIVVQASALAGGSSQWVILSTRHSNASGTDGESAAVAASFSKLPAVVPWSSVWLPREDPYGCTAYTNAPADAVVTVKRGRCGFQAKARLAGDAGLRGMIVVSNSSEYRVMTGDANETRKVDIVAVMVPDSVGQPLLNMAENHEALEVALKPFKLPLIDGSEVVMTLLATTLVALGAYVSTADLRKDSAEPKKEGRRAEGRPRALNGQESALSHAHQAEEVQNRDAFAFFVVGSCMLIVQFALMKYLIYVIIAFFCIGGGAALFGFLHPVIGSVNAKMRERVRSFPVLGSISLSEILAGAVALLVLALFITFRNTPTGWIFQDMIGIGLLCQWQKSLRLPNMQVATLLLSLMFVFDIFWVFVSPLLFKGKSVMEEVATAGHSGESVPLLLRLPRFRRSPLHSERLLGFGDIALPGLLVSYCLRHDLLNKRSGCYGYFVPCLTGYFLGFCATMSAMLCMQKFQPALLYLVPGTLGTTLCLGLIRGELGSLWTGSLASDKKRDRTRQGAADTGELSTLVGHSDIET